VTATPTEPDAIFQRAIGEAVRLRRESAGLSMRALAVQVGVSQPFLSQLERGLTAASISTLYRLAAALGVAPGDLLPLERRAEVVVIRSGDGLELPVSEEPTAAVGTMAIGPGARMSLTEYRVRPGEKLDSWFETDTDITLHVIDGELLVEVPGIGEWHLRAGDTLLQSGRLRRRWRQVGSVPTHLVVVDARHDSG
jgi:transcriptional regulator with XRE-family HTH domain